ncbi:hypothetical protein FBU59_006023, partial [Linderina macrospora]
MQDPKPKIPLPRGSVFDRVKWIEKTHGPSNPLADKLSSGGKGKVKLPRASRVSERAGLINETNEQIKERESLIPKLSDISVLSGKQSAKQPVQPSPVISEASTIEVPPALDTSVATAGVTAEQGAFSAPVMDSVPAHADSLSNALSPTAANTEPASPQCDGGDERG